MAPHPLSSLTMLTAFFAAAPREAAARRTGCVTRASTMTGQLFLAVGTCGAWREATTPCAHLAAPVTPWDEHVDGSPDAIAQRRPKRAHAFLQEMIQHALAPTHAIASGCEDGFCAALPNVSLADRPSGALPDRLNAPCPGSGGSAAQAGATMQAVWDSQSRRLAHGALTAWNIPDQQEVDNGVA
jgi:hypothetical protein